MLPPSDRCWTIAQVVAAVGDSGPASAWPVNVARRRRSALAFALAAVGGGAAFAAAPSERWQSLFDGRSLAGWVQTGFEGGGAVRVERPFRGSGGAIVIEAGTTLSGLTWRDGASLPRTNYELALEAMRLRGGDFFCCLTFPVGRSAGSFVVGGWGGTQVGLSSVDRLDASQNETAREMEFADDRWYRIRVRVTEAKIEAWIDETKCVDLPRAGRTIGLRPGEIQKSLPLGVATYMTRAALREIRLRRL
jgi:hypothetical protein